MSYDEIIKAHLPVLKFHSAETDFPVNAHVVLESGKLFDANGAEAELGGDIELRFVGDIVSASYSDSVPVYVKIRENPHREEGIKSSLYISYWYLFNGGWRAYEAQVDDGKLRSVVVDKYRYSPEEFELDNGRKVVYVSLKTHNLYVKTGVHLPFDHTDGQGPSLSGEPVLIESPAGIKVPAGWKPTDSNYLSEGGLEGDARLSKIKLWNKSPFEIQRLACHGPITLNYYVFLFIVICILAAVVFGVHTLVAGYRERQRADISRRAAAIMNKSV